MIRIPVALERRLQELFPRARERDQFVTSLIEEALTKQDVTEDRPERIGGTLHLYTDGGSRGNPGQSAIGIVLKNPDTDTIIEEHAECIGIETNNVAEYRALIEGMRIAHKHHPNHLVCHLDSELVVKQLNGEYRVKMPSLQAFVDEILELKLQFPLVEFVYIPRAKNYRADSLVNKALDAHPSPHYGR